jgi:hypothetical protein
MTLFKNSRSLIWTKTWGRQCQYANTIVFTIMSFQCRTVIQTIHTPDFEVDDCGNEWLNSTNYQNSLNQSGNTLSAPCLVLTLCGSGWPFPGAWKQDKLNITNVTNRHGNSKLFKTPLSVQHKNLKFIQLGSHGYEKCIQNCAWETIREKSLGMLGMGEKIC